MKAIMLEVTIFFENKFTMIVFEKQDNIEKMQNYIVMMIRSHNNGWIHLNAIDHENNISINLSKVFNIQYNYIFGG